MTFENFIPPRSKNVLEVTGEVSTDFETTRKNFLEIQPACDYTISKNLPNSNKNFDTILIQSPAIGTLSNDELVNQLKKASKLLKPHGRLIFTLDNIGYAENIMAILEGKPLKFKVTLTKVELEDAIKAAGLNEYNSLNAARQAPIARGVAEASKTDPLVFSYIIFATPEELPKRISIQAVLGEKMICGQKRIYEPQTFLATEPNFANFYHEGGKPYRLFTDKEFDKRIFINQRISSPTFTDGKILFEKLSKAGYLYIEEMDDHPIRWKESYGKTGNINFIGVHGIQTTTEYLADYFRQFNPNVKVFSNQLKSIAPLRNFKKQENSTVRIFFGALNRDEEFKDLLPIMNQIAQKYGDKVEFKILANKEHFEALESKNKILVGDPNYYNGQYVPYEKYLETLRESDIALLPLLDNEFNRSKSDLKFIECGACGAAVLASPVVYSKTVKDGKTGLIYNDKSEFSRKLQFLIENREKRCDIATAAYNYVKNNRLLCQHYEERLDWYNELFERLDELNAETTARIEKFAPEFKDEKPQSIQSPPAKPEGKIGPNAEIIIPV